MSSEDRLLININDQPLYVEKGTTILNAARQNGIYIPTLCDYPGLPSPGSCRICIVEIQGRQNMPTSCTTPVEDGMVIYTHSPKVEELRAELIQMLLAEHPSACFFCSEKDHCDECMITLRKAGLTTGCGSCPKDGQCEFQSLVEKYGGKKLGYPIYYRMLPIEKSDPFFDRDYNLCVLCGRCIRICESLHFTNILTFTSRGTYAMVGTAFHRSHLEAGCTFCGSCVEVCPTGALSEKTRKWDGKPDGETASTCPLCSIGCQINLLTKQGRVLGSLPNHSSGAYALCAKGRFGISELVNHTARVKKPSGYVGDTQQQFNWGEAIDRAAEKLSACSPERFEMRVSTSCTNEDLFVAARFVREVMKTGSIRSSSQISYGNGLGIVSRLLQNACSLESIGEARVILCIGLDDPYAQSVVEVQLHNAKKQGAKIIHLSSHKLDWSEYVDEWLSAEEGREIDLIQALVHLTGDKLSTLQSDGQRKLPEAYAVKRASRLLKQVDHPVIILGPSILVCPDNHSVLQSVELLIKNLNARVIVLPDEINLVGALRLGLFSNGPVIEGHNLDVLYLIGEGVPEKVEGSPYIIYQNLYPPSKKARIDLLLPTSAFTEENGTFIDHAGRVKHIHQAVQPPGEALPSWMILSGIARQMGAQGFEYSSVEDIRRQAQSEFPCFLEDHSAIDWTPDLEIGKISEYKTDCSQARLAASTNLYMGFPLTQWVDGLRNLYPGEMIEGADEPNS